MPTSMQSDITRRVRQVRRRLWLAEFLQDVFMGWAGAFLAAAIYFVVHPLIWGRVSENHGWLILALAAVSGIFAGAVWTWKRAPGTLDSALALDDKFALKERVTTYFSLTAEQLQTPAGQALLEDVHEKLASLDVNERFAIRMKWSQALRPVITGTLALLAFFFFPELNFSLANSRSDNPLQAKAEETKRQLDEIKKAFAAKQQKDVPRTKEEKELEEKLNKLLERNLADEKQLRETLDDVRTLQDKMQERINDLKEQAFKNREVLAALEKLSNLPREKNGPGKDFEDALAKGDVKKAAAELDKLQKILQNNQLSKEEMRQLAERLETLQRELSRLYDNQDLRDLLAKQLQDELKAGNLSDEEKQRLQDLLDKELSAMKQDLADLKDLAGLLDALKEGVLDMVDGMDADGAQLGGKLAKLKGKLDKLGKLDADMKELARLKGDQEQMEAMRLAVLRGMQPNNVPVPGAGTRPAGAEPKNSDAFDQRVKQEADWKKLRVTGYSRGGTFSKIPAQEVTGSFQQAQQEASEASATQRIPADVADISKGYFQRLGSQK